MFQRWHSQDHKIKIERNKGELDSEKVRRKILTAVEVSAKGQVSRTASLKSSTAESCEEYFCIQTMRFAKSQEVAAISSSGGAGSRREVR